MHGEVPAAQVRRADLRDEGLVRRSVEALADAEEHGRERDHEERRGGREPVAARVDEEPGDRPEQRHQHERAHPAPALDPARERQLDQHDRHRVDEEDGADLMLADLRLVAREGGEEGEQRVPGRDEEEVQRPEAEEGLVAKDRCVRRGCVACLVRGDARVANKCQHAEVGEECERIQDEENRECGRVVDARDQAGRRGRRGRSLGSSSRAAARKRRGDARRSETGDQRRLARPERRRCPPPRSRGARTPATATVRAAAARTRPPGERARRRASASRRRGR